MKRREFLRRSAALGGLAGNSRAITGLLQGAEITPGTFEPVTSRAGIYHDVVNVGVIRSNGKALLIDSGESSILRDAKRLGASSIEWVLYTHYHRDQCSGARLLKKTGAKLGVPASEAEFFRNANDFWLGADKILDHRYNFRPEIFVLRESVMIDREIRPGDVFEWENIPIEIIGTPGHTDGSLTYLVNVDGEKIAFVGDLIYGPGQLWEFYSLQKRFPGMEGDYWGFGGGVLDLKKSLQEILSHQPTLLIPSHGVVIRRPEPAVSLLERNLNALMKNYATLTAWRTYHAQGNAIFKLNISSEYAAPMLPPLPRAKLPEWVHRAADTSWYIQAEDRSIFLLDCGFDPILRALDRLTKSGAASGVDGIWISHYHDDHVNSVNEVRKKYGAKVYVQKELQDVLENPRAYSLPALMPESIHVDHPLSEGELINWKGHRLTAYYFPGQTLYHDGLLIEHGGDRIFMSGDSFANWGIDDYCSYNRNFLGKDGEAKGYARCLRLLLKLKPDLLVAAHWGPEPISPDYLRRTVELLEEREKLCAKLFPWDDPNFGLDPAWASVYPYRQTVSKGQPVMHEARIYNHSDSPRQAWVELRAPSGWQIGEGGSMTIAPHTEGRFPLRAAAPPNPSHPREVLTLAVQFGGRNLGEIAEAIVDYLP